LLSDFFLAYFLYKVIYKILRS